MDDPIRMLTLAEQADAAARRHLECGEELRNPFAGTADEAEFARRYFIALQRLQALPTTQGSA